ncbi:MAG: cyclic nucleotide-binding domain-containing protein [Dehalococcoidia bacterium]|nr:cyclic nucleotide-binding domain-containing protein [Dehalococcoidia bacterium]
MAHWMCTSCGYYFQGAQPPDACPGCRLSCAFNNVTCYRPECGGENNLDPLLVGATLSLITSGPQESKATPEAKPRPGLAAMEAVPIAQIMSGLSLEQRGRISGLGKIRIYEQGDLICSEGDEAKRLYLIEDGQVAVQSELSKGLRISITIVLPGQAFGWSAIIPPYRYTAAVVALSRVRVIAIERDALLAFMRDHPTEGLTFMQNVAGIIASRLRNVAQELAGLIQQGTR